MIGSTHPGRPTAEPIEALLQIHFETARMFSMVFAAGVSTTTEAAQALGRTSQTIRGRAEEGRSRQYAAGEHARTNGQAAIGG